MNDTEMKDTELAALRMDIDRIDAQIVELLAQRFGITDQVGVLKAQKKLSAIDPLREAQQAQRYTELAEKFGVPSHVVLKLFRGVIDEVVINHRAIAVQTAFS